jgi:hypothetical protein
MGNERFAGSELLFNPSDIGGLNFLRIEYWLNGD